VAANEPVARTAVQIQFYTADHQPGVSTNAGFARVIARDGALILEIGSGAAFDSLATYAAGAGWRIAAGSRASGQTYAYFAISSVMVR